jgi:hypothetical protein
MTGRWLALVLDCLLLASVIALVIYVGEKERKRTTPTTQERIDSLYPELAEQIKKNAAASEAAIERVTRKLERIKDVVGDLDEEKNP